MSSKNPIEFLSCFGHAISDTDVIKNAEDIIMKFSAREKCAKCSEAYNCLSLASINAGYGSDALIEKFLQGMKLMSILQNQFSALKMPMGPITEQNLLQAYDMTEKFIAELKKDENKKLREILIEQLKSQYSYLTKNAQALKDFIEQLDGDIGGFTC
jgi:hypothetical protein